MVKVTVRIESYPTTDIYWRSHGLAIDQELNEDWWISQPHKQIAVTPPQPFTHEETLDLAEGEHTVEYAVSGYVPDYAWHARVYVDGKLVAEGDVGRRKADHLKARFTVTAPIIDTWWWTVALTGALAGVIIIGSAVAYNEMVKKRVS
jgi:hypothetical protein